MYEEINQRTYSGISLNDAYFLSANVKFKKSKYKYVPVYTKSASWSNSPRLST